MLMRVKWKDSLSDNFSIGNGVRQGAVLSPLVFTLYIDMLFIRSRLRLPCRSNLCWILGYADDVTLVAPALYAMEKMNKVCEIFADKIGLLFNPLKSKLLCYNVHTPILRLKPVYMKSIWAILLVTIFMIEYIKEYACRFIGKTNANLCDFGSCDSSTLVNSHITFYMDLYGCEFWNISSKYTEEMHTAWRIVMRKI